MLGPRSRAGALVAVLLLAPVALFLASLTREIPHVNVRVTKVHLDASDVRDHALLSITADIAGDDNTTHGISVSGATCHLGRSHAFRAHLVDVRRAGGTADLAIQLEHGSFEEAVREISGFSAVSCRFSLVVDLFRTGVRIPFVYFTNPYTNPFGERASSVGESTRLAPDAGGRERRSPSVRVVESPAQVAWPTRERKVLRYTATHMLEVAFPPQYNSVIDRLRDVPITVKANVRYADSKDTGAFSADAAVDGAVKKILGKEGAVFAVPVSLVGHTDLPKAAAVLLAAYAGGGGEGQHFRLPLKPDNRPRVLPIRATAPRSPLAKGFGAHHTVSIEDEHEPGSHDFVQFLRLGSRHLSRRLGKAQSVAQSPEDVGLSLHTKLKFDDAVMARVDGTIKGGNPVLTADFSLTMRFHFKDNLDDAKTFSTKGGATPISWKEEATAITVGVKAELNTEKPAAFANITGSLVTDWNGGKWEASVLKHESHNDPVTWKVDLGFDNTMKMADFTEKICIKKTGTEKSVALQAVQYTGLSTVSPSSLAWYYKNTMNFVLDPPSRRRLAEVIGQPTVGRLAEASEAVNSTLVSLQPVVRRLAAEIGGLWEAQGGRRLNKCGLSSTSVSCLESLLAAHTTETKKESTCIEFKGLADLDGDLAVTSDLDIRVDGNIENTMEVTLRLLGTKPTSSTRKWVASADMVMTPKRQIADTVGAATTTQGEYRIREGMGASATVDSDEATAGKFKVTGTTKAAMTCKVSAAERSAHSTFSATFDASQPMCRCTAGSKDCNNGKVICCRQQGMLEAVEAKDINKDFMNDVMTLDMNRPFSIFSLGMDGKMGDRLTVKSATQNGKEITTWKVFDDKKVQQLKVENTNTKNSKGGTDSVFRLYEKDRTTQKVTVDLSTEDQDKTLGVSVQATPKDDNNKDENTLKANIQWDHSDVRWGDGGKVVFGFFEVDSKDGKNRGMDGFVQFDVRKAEYGDYGLAIAGKLNQDGTKLVMEPKVTINRKNADAQFLDVDVKLGDEGDLFKSRLSYDSKNSGDLRQFRAQAEDKDGVTASGSVDLTKKSSAPDGDERWDHDSAVSVRNDAKVLEKQLGLAGLYVKTVDGNDKTQSLTATLKDKDAKSVVSLTGSFQEVKDSKMEAKIRLEDSDSKVITDSALTLTKKKAGNEETFTALLDVRSDKQLGSIDGSFVKDPQQGKLMLALKDDKGDTVMDMSGTLPKVGSFFDGPAKMRYGDNLKDSQNFNLRLSDGWLKTTKFFTPDYETFTMNVNTKVENTDIGLGLELEKNPHDGWLSGAGLSAKMVEANKVQVDISVYADFKHKAAPAAVETTAIKPDEPTVTTSTMIITLDDPEKLDMAALKTEMAKAYGISESDITLGDPEFRVAMSYEMGGSVTEQQAKDAMAKEFGVDSKKVEVKLSRIRRRRLAVTTNIDATVVTTSAAKAKTVKSKSATIASDPTILQQQLASQGATGVTVKVTKAASVKVSMTSTMKSQGKPKTLSSSQRQALAKASGGTGLVITNTQTKKGRGSAGAAHSVSGRLAWMLPLLALTRRMAA